MNQDLIHQLIQLTQGGLPVVSQPFAQIAAQLNVQEADVLADLKQMLGQGAIRRIAAVPNHYKLGYVANGMTVWDVDDSLVDKLGQKVGQLPFVTHSYRRPRHPGIWNYNLFAMVHGKSRDECRELAKQIEEILGSACKGHEILFSTRILKKTGFRKNTP